MSITNKKVGVLGGGQLGKMLCVAAAPWHLELSVLDRDISFPAAPYCHSFVAGDFSNFDDVVSFGSQLDLVTIEIESVNEKALLELQSSGVEAHPRPGALAIIKDKGVQAKFYRKHGFPYPAFGLYENLRSIRAAIAESRLRFPFVQKVRTEGYDGRGVVIVKDKGGLDNLLDSPSLVMEMIDIHKEVAVIAARNSSGQITTYDPVEMVFHPGANLLDYLQCPADLEARYDIELRQIASALIEQLDICGLLAVEFFIDKAGNIWVNEVAPRPHNSGHHSIESCVTSQYEQHLRAILDLPLGSTQLHSSAVMVNLLGEEGKTGPARIRQLTELFKTEGARLHWYGKSTSKPYRKMGHITLIGDDIAKLRSRALYIQERIKVTA